MDGEETFNDQIETWIEGLEGRTPTVDEVGALLTEIGLPSIKAYCDSFASAAVHLAVLLQGIIAVHRQVASSAEDARVILGAQVLEEIEGAVEHILTHVNADDVEMEMIHMDVPDREDMN